MESRAEILLKPYWFASDIEIYFQISRTQAEIIKREVQNLGHTPSYSDGKQKVSVIADEVIKYMGGNNRLEEMRLLESYSNIERKN